MIPKYRWYDDIIPTQQTSIVQREFIAVHVLDRDSSLILRMVPTNLEAQNLSLLTGLDLWLSTA